MKTKELTITQDTFKTDSEKATALKIISPETMQEATELLSRANKYLDTVVAYKKSKTDPINKALKIIRAETKPLEDALTSIIDDLRAKATKYQTKLLATQEAQKQAIAQRIGDGKGKIHLETAISKIEAIETPDKKVITDSGSISFHPVKHFEVMDITMLPIEYHEINEQKIKESMKIGIELEGVRYWTEQEPINRRK